MEPLVQRTTLQGKLSVVFDQHDPWIQRSLFALADG